MQAMSIPQAAVSQRNGSSPSFVHQNQIYHFLISAQANSRFVENVHHHG